MQKENKPDSSHQAYRDAFRLSAKSSSIHREKKPPKTTIEIILDKTFGIKAWLIYGALAILYILVDMGS